LDERRQADELEAAIAAMERDAAFGAPADPASSARGNGTGAPPLGSAPMQSSDGPSQIRSQLAAAAALLHARDSGPGPRATFVLGLEEQLRTDLRLMPSAPAPTWRRLTRPRMAIAAVGAVTLAAVLLFAGYRVQQRFGLQPDPAPAGAQLLLEDGWRNLADVKAILAADTRDPVQLRNALDASIACFLGAMALADESADDALRARRHLAAEAELEAAAIELARLARGLPPEVRRPILDARRQLTVRLLDERVSWAPPGSAAVPPGSASPTPNVPPALVPLRPAEPPTEPPTSVAAPTQTPTPDGGSGSSPTATPVGGPTSTEIAAPSATPTDDPPPSAPGPGPEPTATPMIADPAPTATPLPTTSPSQTPVPGAVDPTATPTRDSWPTATDPPPPTRTPGPDVTDEPPEPPTAEPSSEVPPSPPLTPGPGRIARP